LPSRLAFKIDNFRRATLPLLGQRGGGFSCRVSGVIGRVWFFIPAIVCDGPNDGFNALSAGKSTFGKGPIALGLRRRSKGR